MKKTYCPMWMLGLLAGVAILYIFMNTYDATYFWYQTFMDSGMLNTFFHSVLTIGEGPTRGGFAFWKSVPKGFLRYFADAFPGILFALFPVSALLCKGAGKKIISIILSVFGLAVSMLGLGSVSSGINLISAAMLLQIVVCISVCLSCIIGKGDKIFLGLCGIAAIISLLLSVYLTDQVAQRTYSSFEFMPHTDTIGIERIIFASYDAYQTYPRLYAIYLWPYSRSIWFVLIGVGFFINAFGSMFQMKKTTAVPKITDFSYLEEYKKNYMK